MEADLKKGASSALVRLKAIYGRLPKGSRTLVKAAWLALRRFGFWLPYAVSRMRAFCSRQDGSRNDPSIDVLFVMDLRDRDWILGGICREIARETKGRVDFYYHKHFYSPTDRDPYWPRAPKLPPAKNYFFADSAFFAWCLKANPALWSRQTVVLHNHSEKRVPDRELVFALNRATHTISMGSANRRHLTAQGVKSRRIHVVTGGADPTVFASHERSPNGVVGFCTAFYPRKNPDRLVELVQRLPHRKFVLLGRRWQEYCNFQRLIELPNFEYVEASYDAYPAYYRQMTVFVSVSLLEGGPIPLLEAMMSNVVPVATRTGFAEDLIQDGKNGYLFDPHVPTAEISRLIEAAFLLKSNIRSTVERYSWTAFAKDINRKFC